MNNYLKIFITAVIIVGVIPLFSLGYSFLRMADTMLNAGGILLLVATALGAYWCLNQMWIKDIPKDATLFGNKRAEGGKPEEKKEESK